MRSAAPPYLCLPAQRARLPLQHNAAFPFIELSLTFELPARSRIRSFACHSGSLASLLCGDFEESKSPKGAALSDSESLESYDSDAVPRDKDEDSDGSDLYGHLAAVTSNANKFNTVSRYPIRTYPIPAPPSLHRRAPATT